MAKTYTGIDIGSGDIKFAVCSGGSIRRMSSYPLPANLMRDGVIVSPEAMAGVLREAAKAGHINVRDCAVSLPGAVSFFRRFTVPAMTVDQLKLNLPYEFHDFITQEKDKYFYDYAVAGVVKNDDGSPKELDLMAAAAPKATIASYASMLRRAGFRLRIAMPDEFAYANLLREYEKKNPGKREYCILDLGNAATRVHMFTGPNYETTRIIEYGGAAIDSVIAEICNVDTHVARLYKLANHNGVLNHDVCRGVYQAIAVEVLRAINFYNFNNADSSLTDVYLCGGGALIAPLAETIRSTLELKIHSIAELMPETAGENTELVRYPIAAGVTLS
ncbi:MAG: pilus assembly protein PilM [Oscillospiraceae bacterium]